MNGVIGTRSELVELLHAAHRYDDLESVSIREHGLQTASLLRQRIRDDDELHVAGLVHDVGWLERAPSGEWRARHDAAHDQEARRLVQALLGVRVGNLVAGHVDAKRYLVTVDDAYRGELSDRSRETLGFQGAGMSAVEVAAFERHAEFEALIALRRADEAAKVVGVDAGRVEDWIDVIDRVIPDLARRV